MIDFGRDRVRELLVRVVRLSRDEQLTLIAAGVAFYAFLSLIPVALLVVALATSIGGEALANQVTVAVSDVLTPSAQQLLADSLVDDAGRRGATVIGILGLIWGASRVFRGLDRAFSEVYGTAGTKSLLDTAWDAFVVAVSITVGVSIVGGFEIALLLLPGLEPGLIGPALVLAGLVIVFMPIYVVFPGHDISVREALPGTIVASIGWFLLSRLFGLYAQVAGDYTVYGAVGAVFLVLVWLYAASSIVVLGAVINVVLAGRDTDRQLQTPGRPISTEAMSDDGTGPEDRGDERVRSRTRDRSQDPEALREEIERLRNRIESFESDVERRTVDKPTLEGELKRYVRSRLRRGHARGWGPYLVLLYGTGMTIAAFYFLSGGWAILAMFVVWTSTLGVYLLMVLFGAGLALFGAPGRVRDRVNDWRS